MQASLEAAHAAAQSIAPPGGLAALRSQRDAANSRVRELEGVIAGIDDQLKQVEQLVIADAVVVATTLTRAYLRDSIRSRRFDTVLLDEASMAPLPALWVAASLADRAVVAVGDFRQLPPIVQSADEIAQRWLGRDVFEVAGVDSTTGGPDHLVKLIRQYRMHPSISRIANELVYDQMLEDDASTSTIPAGGWYNSDRPHDEPVLLVDTEAVHAWVTTASRGDRASRLNFLSATICVDLARQVLREDRPALPAGERPRVLIVCPYRPHSQLINLLLREQGLDGEVRAGTAHTFQGSEAEVVILDLVNDEPHWKVGLFMQTGDDDNRRLLNVAITRARRRLIIVGDIAYNTKTGKKAFIGRELLPLLSANYPTVSAVDVIPTGLAARAATAQATIGGGDVEPIADRVVVSQNDFFPLFINDLAHATRRVVVFSPFLTANRIGQLEVPLRALVEREVPVYAVTRSGSDRNKTETPEYRRLERQLTEWGIVVIHKRRMHEKLVFVDDDIIWCGSLNPLSFADTQEVMERRKNHHVFDDYAKTMRLDDLVGGFATSRPVCPVCAADMETAEAKTDPFYWVCPTKGCYARSIGAPELTDGRLVCATCAGAVEYGEWGGEPHWRCIPNKKHRLRVVPTHLKLPKMRAIVPKRELKRLDRIYGTAPT